MKSRKISLDIETNDEIDARIFYHFYENVGVKTFLVSFGKNRRVLSTMEGFKMAKFVGNHYDPQELWERTHRLKIAQHKAQICKDLKIYPDDTAMLFTGADMDNISIKTEEYRNIKICACVTAGVKSNAQRIGVDKPGSIEIDEEKFEDIKHGTVNIIIITNAFLTDGAMARSLITITEAKTIAFEDLLIKSSYNPKIFATGTGTDNAIIVSGCQQRISYTGGHAKFGELMAKATTSAVKEAIFRQNGIR